MSKNTSLNIKLDSAQASQQLHSFSILLNILKITGAVFVDLIAAYDRVNHRRILTKVLDMTKDSLLINFLGVLLKNRRFFVEFNARKNRVRWQRNGLSQGSVLAPLLYNIYTNDQPQYQQTSRFIYASLARLLWPSGWLLWPSGGTLNALQQLNDYYKINNLRANPSKTQVCVFHLKNRYANRKLNNPWNGEQLQHYAQPVYLSVTLDFSLSFKEDLIKTKAKVSTRNNTLRKLLTSKWGATPHVLRTSALAPSYSAAEYACPVWERSAHAKRLDPVLNESCRLITGCLKPTNVNNLHLLAGVAPPEIRREAVSKLERSRQAYDPRHMLFNHQPAPSRLKSRRSFLHWVELLKEKISTWREEAWKRKLKAQPQSTR